MTAVLAVVLAFWFAADVPSSNSIVLDTSGRQGAVTFDHAAHVLAARDPKSAHPAPAQASCGGCHHTHNARGVIQLTRCGACHGPEGDPRNPKSIRTSDEENRKTAFHGLCIGCHVDLANTLNISNTARTGPVDCADCHSAGARGRG